MFHTYIDRIYRPGRSFLMTAITLLTLLAFLLIVVFHLTLAWSNSQAAILVLGEPDFTSLGVWLYSNNDDVSRWYRC